MPGVGVSSLGCGRYILGRKGESDLYKRLTSLARALLFAALRFAALLFAALLVGALLFEELLFAALLFGALLVLC